MRKVVQDMSRPVAWYSAAVTICIVAFGLPLLRLFGHDFTAAFAPLCLLSIAELAAGLAGPVNTICSLTGKERAVAVITAVSAVILFAGSLAAAKIMGPIGIALAALLATLFRCALLSVVVYRHIGFIPFATLFPLSRR
jgi:O-antigen/teichoic acid export membrane protein